MSNIKNKTSQKGVQTNKTNHPKEVKEMDLNIKQDEIVTDNEKDTSTITENENIEVNNNKAISNEVAPVATKNEVTTNNKEEQLLNKNASFISTKVERVNEKGEEISLQFIETEINGKAYKTVIPYKKHYMGDKNYLYHYELNKNGESDYTLISDCPIFPTKIIENIDTDKRKVELSILKNNKWIAKIIPADVLYNKPTELSQYGLKITSSNAKYFKEYIINFELENEIPIMNTVDHLGWRNNNKEFIPYSETLKFEDEEILEGYSESGTLEDWCNSISKYRNNNIFRFILSSAFTAPLVSLLNERPFMVYNFAPSRSGKTALLNIAISAFGNPKNLITTFNSTSVGLERLLQINNNLPVAIDEKQIADTQKSIEKMVFMISNQEGRVRGNKYGGLAPQTKFSNVVLSTGEEPLTQISSTTGIATRCLEVEGSAFENENEAAEMYKITSKYYGTAGRVFIDNLIKNYSDNDYQELKNKLKELKDTLEEKSDSNVGSYISAVALVTLADILASKYIFNEDNEELSIKVGLQILNGLSRAEEIDVTEKCYETLKSYIIANHHRFGTYITHCLQQSPEDDVLNYTSIPLGVYENGIYYIFIHEIENFMNKNKFNYRKMMKEFAKREYIIPSYKEDGTLKSTSVQKKYHNHNTRFYAFPIEEVETISQFFSFQNQVQDEDVKEKEKEPKKSKFSKQMNYKMGEW